MTQIEENLNRLAEMLEENRQLWAKGNSQTASLHGYRIQSLAVQTAMLIGELPEGDEKKALAYRVKNFGWGLGQWIEPPKD